MGMTVVSVIGDAQEIEDEPAVSLFAARLPDARFVPARLEVEATPDGDAVVGWPEGEELAPGTDAPTLLLLADPFSFPVDGFLRRLNEDLPHLTVIGGMASAATRPGGNTLVLDDTVVDSGAVGVFITGAGLHTVVSQGCRPIGDPYVVTGAQRNFVEELAGRPALDRLRELADAVSDEDRALLQQGLHLGVVVDEHRVDFGRGDFLVRNVLGGDRETGAMAVGDRIEVGRTVQFHVRDAAAADEDLRVLLERRAGRRPRSCSRATAVANASSVCPTTTPASSPSCSARSRRPAGSAPVRSAPSAATASCTASPPASPSSPENELPPGRAPLRNSGAERAPRVGYPGSQRQRRPRCGASDRGPGVPGRSERRRRGGW